MITPIQLKEVTKIQDINVLTTAVNSINSTFDRFQINTPLRECHFLAQILHETGNLRLVKENLNYSADGLANTFPNRYGLKDSAGKYMKNNLGRIIPNPLAVKLERKPMEIANNLYCDRMGNGNEASGDGYKFIGRGWIQTTGRANYTAFSNFIKVDCVTHPEFLETPQYAALSAGYYWDINKLNSYADKDDILGITKKINGGTKGLDDRTAKLKLLKSILLPKTTTTGSTSNISTNKV